jgi:hypothetical protein
MIAGCRVGWSHFGDWLGGNNVSNDNIYANVPPLTSEWMSELTSTFDACYLTGGDFTFDDKFSDFVDKLIWKSEGNSTVKNRYENSSFIDAMNLIKSLHGNLVPAAPDHLVELNKIRLRNRFEAWLKSVAQSHGTNNKDDTIFHDLATLNFSSILKNPDLKYSKLQLFVSQLTLTEDDYRRHLRAQLSQPDDLISNYLAKRLLDAGSFDLIKGIVADNKRMPDFWMALFSAVYGFELTYGNSNFPRSNLKQQIYSTITLIENKKLHEYRNCGYGPSYYKPGTMRNVDSKNKNKDFVVTSQVGPNKKPAGSIYALLKLLSAEDQSTIKKDELIRLLQQILYPHAMGFCEMDYSGSYMMLLLLNGFLLNQKWDRNFDELVKLKFLFAKIKQQLLSQIYSTFGTTYTKDSPIYKLAMKINATPNVGSFVKPCFEVFDLVEYLHRPDPNSSMIIGSD